MNIFELDKLSLFYDAEFTGLHRNSTLISIGIVSETGSTFYAEFTDYDKSQVNDWIQENVISNLKFNVVYPFCTVIPRDCRLVGLYHISMKGDSDKIQRSLLEWIINESSSTGKQVQFFSDCYAYDWMLLNDLICPDRNALNLDHHIYYIPMDLSTVLQVVGVDPDISREQFIGSSGIDRITHNIASVFDPLLAIPKHNSLWDAFVCKECFHQIMRDYE